MMKIAFQSAVLIRKLRPNMSSVFSNAARKGMPVELAIALIITCSTLLLGSVLVWQNYRSTEQVLVSVANESARQIGKVLNERAHRLIDTPRSVIQVLAYSPIMQATTLQQRLDRMPQLIDSLKANDMLSTVFVGYPNGEFISLRDLSNPRLKDLFSTPPGSKFLVHAISMEQGGDLAAEWRFYDQDFQLLEIQQKADYQFDPRTRPWFKQATDQTGLSIIKPYVFFLTEQVGITLAQRAETGKAVIGMDVAIDDLNDALADLQITSSAEMAVVDSDGTVIAYPDMQRLRVPGEDQQTRLLRIDELGIPSLANVFQNLPKENASRHYHIDGQGWYGMHAPLLNFSGDSSQLVLAVPEHELLYGARQTLIRESSWVAALTLLLMAVGWILSRRLSRPLQLLANQVRAYSSFNFSSNIKVSSLIAEVRELNHVLSDMSRTIRGFQDISLALNYETQLDRMLGVVLEKLVDVFKVKGGAIFLAESDSDFLRLAAHCGDSAYPGQLVLDIGSDGDLTLAVVNALGLQADYLCVHLVNRNHDRLGVLILQLKSGEWQCDDDQHAFQRFVHELSGAAAVAIETRQLIEAQQQLLNAMIKLLANAIDAKSPYTGAHCERVPLLAELLLNEVIAADSGPYANFAMSHAERYEFHIAAWLHDCGKISSPEAVMDKATKLEVQYNRIHEIRMRFEVLWRDAAINYWQKLAQGGDPHGLQQILQQQQARLQEEFALVAQANIGGELMEDSDIKRLHQIGARRWWRQFDNRLGLAPHEIERLGKTAVPAPAQEYLLADRPDHLVHWGDRKPHVDKNDPDNVWGFDMCIPAYAYNYGELYNLSIRRGTLTTEERFKIKEHIVQTIIMLNSLPLPAALKRVPDIAGNHHEKMDGTGYPRRLGEDDLSIPERVVMIADIFEALTASDRPYKIPKTLSESVGILINMARNGHIDPDLFRLFLTSGVYLTYGRQFLNPAQIDHVDVQACLDRLDEYSAPDVSSE